LITPGRYAKSNGAKYLEGLSVDPDSPAIGLWAVSTFEKEGFRYVKDVGVRDAM
jgi:hypothetical protein